MNTPCQTLPDTKRRLLDASMQLMLRQGFTATTVDQICEEAELTKGSFFHYFKSKEEIGEAALEHFCKLQAEQMQQGAFNQLKDPLDRFHGLLDFYAEKVREPKGVRSCLLGNLSQELAATHPVIRCKCDESFSRYIHRLTALLKEAREVHPPKVDFDPESVATLCLSLMQGSLILVKARQDTTPMLDNIEHFRAYVEGLFGRKRRKA